MMKNSTFSRRTVAALLAISLTVCASSAYSQQAPIIKKKLLNPNQGKLEKEAPGAKVSTELKALKEEYDAFQTKKNARAVFEPASSLLQVRNGYVVVDAAASSKEQVNALLNELKALGMKNAVSYQHIVSGLMPIGALDKISSLKSVRFVRPAYKPHTNVGFVTSQGDAAQRSDLARSGFRVNGKGSTVGVLSDSYNNLTGEKFSVLNGELPGKGNPNGFTKPVHVLSDLDGGGTDEGRAIMEIIHDVAPGANLAFHTASNGQAAFAKGILDLAKAGCNVIVDDILYFAEPYFQDGIIAQAVDEVAKKGVTYFSSAGNEGRDSYESAFKPSGIGYVSGEAHSFAPGDVLQSITIPVGSKPIIILQWDDPFFSVTGDTLAAAKTDLDIYLINETGDTLITGSASDNLKSGDPIEGFSFTNDGTTTKFNLLIERISGPAPRKLKYIIYKNEGSINEYNTASPTIVGHHNATGAVTTGAARYDRTPAFGVVPPRKESFSSIGGVPILFDMAGNRIAPIDRKKPEITSVDGGNTTFFFPGLDYEGDGFPNFFGTSASAPHAAAVAALVREAAGKSLTPFQVKGALLTSTIDMDDPFTVGFNTGFDYATGAGLIQADVAVGSVFTKQIATWFTLINADTDKDIGLLAEGTVINLADLPTRNLNIRANTSPATVGSVVFYLNGKLIRTENVVPYALGSDVGNGDYATLVPALQPGNYSLEAVPYEEAHGKGKKGISLKIKFSVIENAVASFTLVDVATGKDLFPIEENDVLNLSVLPKKLNIRANTVPDTVGSVIFDFDGRKVTENLAPYALGKNLPNNDYAPLTPPLSVGKHTLWAVAYSEEKGQGVKGQPLQVKFSVINDPTQRIARQGTEAAAATVDEFLAYPNPSSDRITISFTLTESQQAFLNVYDTRGTLISPLHAGPAEAGKRYEYQLEGGKLSQGMYISRLVTRNGVKTQKIIFTR